jgi:hypothetical protein
MILANTSLAFDPSWPWSLPGFGRPLLLAVAGLLVALTVWTYVGARGSNFRRLALVLGLRLGALLIACLLVLRPSFAYEEEAVAVPSKLIFGIDYSASMKITDELDNMSRWNHVRSVLKSPRVEELLKRLSREQRIEMLFYQFANDLKKFEPEGEANGKATFTGRSLHELLQRYGREQDLRGVLWISDGADNGPVPAFEKAAAWKSVCPLHTFAVGKTSTSLDQDGIYFDPDYIAVSPAPVPVKGRFTVSARVHAPNNEGQVVRLSLWLEGPDGKAAEIAANNKLKLDHERDNHVSLSADAPLAAGEYKATLKLDGPDGNPLPVKVSEANTQVTTYLTVTDEGVSVLWVEGTKRLESIFAIEYALKKDPQFRVFYAEKLRRKEPPPEQADWFDFEKRRYDVIVIGDISADRFSGGNKKVFSQIQKMVTKQKTGLLMMGGYETFGTIGDKGPNWSEENAGDLLALLPVKIDRANPPQIEPWPDTGFRFEPTAAGLKFMLRVAGDEEASRKVWEAMANHPTRPATLSGMTRAGTAIPGKAVPVAIAVGKDSAGNNISYPVMISADKGGRTLVFGADTTHIDWRQKKEDLPVYERFWRQVILWLAHREDAPGNVWVRLDKRRVSAGDGRVEITVGLRGTQGNKVSDAKFSVKVIAPNKQEFVVPVAPKDASNPAEAHGFFSRADQGGEYIVQVTGSGMDKSDDKSIKIDATASARFLAYAQDREMMQTAADHEFLKKLAHAGGGKFHLASENQIIQFLETLSAQQRAQTKPKPQLWPDWRRNPPSDGFGDQFTTLWSSTALPFFMLFTALLCTEWFLRRRWGMV